MNCEILDSTFSLGAGKLLHEQIYLLPGVERNLSTLMKTFREIRSAEATINEAAQIEESLLQILESQGIQGVEDAINEGIFGGLAGFLVGPSIGKIIAKALGVEKGILYDMLTSRLVSAALGSAIQNARK